MRTRSVRRAMSGHRVGEYHPRAKTPDEDVKLIRELHEKHGLGYGTLADKFELPKGTVRNYCTYRTRP